MSPKGLCFDDIDIRARLNQETSNPEIYLENKLGFETFLLENMEAIRNREDENIILGYKLKIEDTQIDAQMRNAKAHGVEYGIVMGDSKYVSATEKTHTLFDDESSPGAMSRDALIKLLSHIEEKYPPSEGYPKPRIYNQDLDDITHFFR
jgi:hypothetical protein